MGKCEWLLWQHECFEAGRILGLGAGKVRGKFHGKIQGKIPEAKADGKKRFLERFEIQSIN